MATVTKKDLVSALGQKAGINKVQAESLVNDVLEIIAEKLSEGHEVTFRRFGTFAIKVAKPKIGRNPNRPTKQVTIPKRCVLRFNPADELKKAISKLDPAEVED